MDAHVKAGLLELTGHAQRVGGWSQRRAAPVLGIDHDRLGGWLARSAEGRVVALKPRPKAEAVEVPIWT